MKGGTPRASQQVVQLGDEKYVVLNEDQVTQLGGGARSWQISPVPTQEETDKEFALAITFEGGSGATFQSQSIPNGYEYANGWSCDAPNKAGTWPRRATLAPIPISYANSDATHASPVAVPQGWILAYSTYVYVARGRYCCKYALDDTQDSVWPIVEAHDFGDGVFITGRPVVFKNKAYFPLRTGVAGSLARWHELSLPVATTVEQQTVTITGTPTSGNYTLTFDGKTTANIAYNAVASAVQSALRLIAGLEQVTVSSTGSTPNFVHTVVMTGVAGALATASPPQMTVTDSTSGGTHNIAIATTVAGSTDTWRQGSANTQASCFIVNGLKLFRANANTLSSTQAVSTPSIDGDWGATTEVGDSGSDITDMGIYLGDNLVMKTNGPYRFTEDLQAVQELPDLVSVIDGSNGIGMEYSNGYEFIPHKTGLVRWRPGAYSDVGVEQEGQLEGDKSLGWGRVASLAPFGKQLFFAANDAYDGVGVIGSLLPQLGDGRGRDYGVIPHTHVVTSSASYEAVRVVTSTTQAAAPQSFPSASISDDSAVGTVAWTSPTNAALLDGSYASATTGTTHYLKALAPPVNLPTNATPLGIQLEVAKKAGGVATYTPDVNGYVVSGTTPNTSYAAVQAGASLNAVSSSGGLIGIGQLVTGGYYVSYQGLVSFDTSAIPDAATVLSATLTLTSQGLDAGVTTQVVQARLYDFGATITTGDWLTEVSGFAGKTILATAPASSFASVGAHVTLTDVAMPANINKTGSTRILLVTDKQVAGTAPSGLEHLWVEDATSGTVANRPTLTVTYTSGTVDNVVKLVIGGSVTGTNLADVSTNWPTTIGGYTSYGGASTTWGGLPTVAQANASNFGVVFSATVAASETAYIDHMRLTLFYSVPGVADPQSYRIDLQVDTTKTIATGQVYKLPRANLPVVSDPNVAHAASNVQLYSSRFGLPNRNVARIFRDVELWLDANPQANTPGLQVWATVDDGTAFQLNDLNGSPKTALTTGAHRFYFPSTTASYGHYAQLQFKIPATGGGTVGMAASIRDVTLRGWLQSYNADEIQCTLLLGDGEYVDRTSVRRSVKAQRNALKALHQPGAVIPYTDIDGVTGFLIFKKMVIKEAKFKEYDEPTKVAQLVLQTVEYGQ